MNNRFLLWTGLSSVSLCGIPGVAEAAPAVLLAVTAVATIAGTAFSAFSSYQASKTQQKVENYNAGIARNNAILAKRDAVLQSDQTRQEGRRRIGAIRAQAGASGLVSSAGSPLLVAAEEAYETEFLAQKQIYAGDLRAQGFTSEAAVRSVQAKSYGQQAGQALIGGAIGAVGTGVSAFADYKRSKVQVVG